MYPYSSSEFNRAGYKSCFLSWHSDDCEDMGFSVEPLTYCQDDSFYKFDFHNYRDGEDDVNEQLPGLEASSYASCSASLLGDYFYHSVWDGYKCSEGYDSFDDRFNGPEMVKYDFLGWDGCKFSEGCDDLDMVKDSYEDEEMYDSYGSSDKERETRFRDDHIPWFDCNFGFQYKVDEDNGAADLESQYSQTWESWDEMGLYEKIFGNWHNMLRSGTESRVEAELA